MELEVLSITFLASGKISVEVINKHRIDPPIPPALDNLRLRFYMECQPTDTVQQIKETALRMARESLR